jgi:hypothetical protein
MENALCSHTTPSSSHRASLSRSLTDRETIFIAALTQQLPPFCTFARVSEHRRTKIPGCYLIPSIKPPHRKSVARTDNTAWMARAHVPHPTELASFVTRPQDIIIELDGNLTSSNNHGFGHDDGVKIGDFLRIVSSTGLEGGGRITPNATFPEGDKLLYEVVGWSKERDGTATLLSFFILCLEKHVSGSTHAHRAPWQWIIKLA